jgi:hypothetical protein
LSAIWKITIRGQVERLPIDKERLFQFGEWDRPADRRFGGEHRQRVIAARVQVDDRREGKAAQPVWLPATRG